MGLIPLVLLTFFCQLFCQSLFSSASPTAKQQKSMVVAVIDDSSKVDFETKSMNILKSCSVCEVKNLSPYDQNGNFDAKSLPSAISAVQGVSNLLYFGWNRPSSQENNDVVESLKKLIQNGVLIVGLAGIAGVDEPSRPLNKTVLGKVPDLIIIGELKERETLRQQSYFGPEMLTAIQPPKELMNQGKVGLIFVTRLAQNWSKKSYSAQDWVFHFRNTKGKSRKIWVGIDDFFKP